MLTVTPNFNTELKTLSQDVKARGQMTLRAGMQAHTLNTTSSIMQNVPKFVE